MTGTYGNEGSRSAVVEGAGGVVLDPRGRVLVIRHRNGSWVFPKGHLDPGEDHLQAALREVAEEAGVTAFPADPQAAFGTSYVNPRGEQREITWFLLRTEAERPEMGEALFPEGAFLPPSEALQRLSFEEDRVLLQRVMAHLEGVS